jgi:hypothetical protein
MADQSCGINWSLIISCSLGIGNIGAVIALVKLVIAPVVLNVREISASLQELYAARNNHQDRIVKIETVHQLRGCEMPNGHR